MAEIHRMYRTGFAEGPDLVTGVRDGDAARAGLVADNLTLLSLSLHAHHEGEDLRLWDTLAQRAPSCSAHVGRMKVQHAEMLVHLNKLDPALAAAGRPHRQVAQPATSIGEQLRTSSCSP